MSTSNQQCECKTWKQFGFPTCPNCFKDKRHLEASAVEAHLHIEALHNLIKSGDLDTAKKLINDWEVDQCPF